MENELFCPMPMKWHEIYLALLKFWEINLNKASDYPPKPLILAVWYDVSLLDKAVRWRETIEWARRNSCSHLIPEIKEEEKFRGFNERMTSSFWENYPKDESEFEEAVRKGIWFRLEVHYSLRLGATMDKEAQTDLTIKQLLNLPIPPKGYYWADDNGGLRSQDVRTYRLWNNKLGYMTGSE